MSTKFFEKVILVAGGTGGLGRAVSLAFLEQGARVVVTYRKKEEWATLQTAARANSEKLEAASIDVTNEAAARQFVDGVVVRQGRVDALVNTVGAYAGGVKLW